MMDIVIPPFNSGVLSVNHSNTFVTKIHAHITPPSPLHTISRLFYYLHITSPTNCTLSPYTQKNSCTRDAFMYTKSMRNRARYLRPRAHALMQTCPCNEAGIILICTDYLRQKFTQPQLESFIYFDPATIILGATGIDATMVIPPTNQSKGSCIGW